ncbi:MAG: Glycine cleavage system H protein [Leptospirillum sp. Group II 'C75']|jgi:glycine cleavage system H protein|uniref:glycine cleavage system protein GcvH n=1 Tax=Leptospirillum sp. Group II 'CF-1' TaxID=1660083 RepID=UPI0000F0C6EF|nr:glycine cleavage system protein GcvH [Leptospirillum sp. Group II 'CF-1']AKS22644.1 glycine cleavage system protein H [Leptospirillum sp. Group II 'CF-1']EAY57834.1 MAG: Glycine cleavage system H protein [Leptospirillum rubarum]EIJ76054.1 MAG: Glycine cleavage system H protein [Leptospirillum sp. Group II 'C75']
MTEARRYTKTHEWIAPANVQGEWNVGITDFAQEEVTDVVFVELPKVGRSVPRGGEAAIIESVKAAFSIYAPVAGTIVAVNPDLDSDPGLLNRDPYGKGWIFRLKAVQPEEIPVLMDEGAYQKFLKEGGGHPEHG